MKVAAGGVALMVAGIALLAGCEGTVSNTDGSSTVTITPSSTTIEGGTSNVVFKAQGGYAPYAWSVDDTSLGSVTAADDVGIYVSNAVTGVAVVTVVDVRSNEANATVTQE